MIIRNRRKELIDLGMLGIATKLNPKLIEKYAWDFKENIVMLSSRKDLSMKKGFGRKRKLFFLAKNDKNAIDVLTIYWKIKVSNWRKSWGDDMKRILTVTEGIKE